MIDYRKIDHVTRDAWFVFKKAHNLPLHLQSQVCFVAGYNASKSSDQCSHNEEVIENAWNEYKTNNRKYATNFECFLGGYKLACMENSDWRVVADL